MLVVNYPTSNSKFQQFVMNTVTGAFFGPIFVNDFINLFQIHLFLRISAWHVSTSMMHYHLGHGHFDAFLIKAFF